MSEMRKDTADDQTKLALDDFVESVAKLNDGLSEMISSALRMQMLVMEDARNIITEFGAATAAAGARGADKGDI